MVTTLNLVLDARLNKLIVYTNFPWFEHRSLEVRALDQKIQVQTIKPPDQIKFITSSSSKCGSWLSFEFITSIFLLCPPSLRPTSLSSLSYPSHHLPHSTLASLTIFLLHLLPSPLFFLRSILVASQTRVYKLEPRSYELQTHQYVQGKQFELALQVAVSLWHGSTN